MSGFLDVRTLSQISVCEKMLFKLVDGPFFKNMCIKYWYMKQSLLCPNLLLQKFYVNALGMPDIDSPCTRCWLCIFSTKINRNNPATWQLLGAGALELPSLPIGPLLANCLQRELVCVYVRRCHWVAQGSSWWLLLWSSWWFSMSYISLTLMEICSSFPAQQN